MTVAQLIAIAVLAIILGWAWMTAFVWISTPEPFREFLAKLKPSTFGQCLAQSFLMMIALFVFLGVIAVALGLIG